MLQLSIMTGKIIMPLLIAGLFTSGIYGLQTQIDTPNKIDESQLGDYITSNNAPEIINKYTEELPVIVKGGGERGIFPLSEVIKEDFIDKHQEIIYIREVWIPSKSNLESIEKRIKSGMITEDDYEYTAYKWFEEHLNKGGK